MLSRYPSCLIAFKLAGVIAWVTPLPVQAQIMYRCGNTYQDTPCQNAPANKIFSSSGSAKVGSPTPAPVNDVQCSGRGAEAIKLTWQREVGKTLEQQLTGVSSPTQRALIEETYSIRGTAPEVRSAIETACVRRKEDAAKAAALIEAARALDGAARPVASSHTTPQEIKATAPASESGKATVDAGNNKRQTQCEAIKNELNIIKDKQRQGGGIAYQETLNAERRGLDGRSNAQGC